MDDFRRAIEIMMHLSVLPDVLDAGHIVMQQEDRRIEREIEALNGVRARLSPWAISAPSANQV